MAKLEVIINDNAYSYNYPKGWDELTNNEFLKISKFLCLNDIGDAQLSVIKYIFKFKLGWRKPMANTSHIMSLPPSYLHTLVSDDSILGWVFNNTGPTKILLPHFKHNGITYYAPAKSLTNIACVELIAAWYAFSQFSKTQDVVQLNKLVSLIYRPKDRFRFIKAFDIRYNNDVREPLNQGRWDKRQKEIESLPMSVKIAVLKQFSGNWQVFEKKYPQVFTKSLKAKSNDSSLMAMLYDVSGKIFGDMAKTELTIADKVFYYVSKQIKEAKEMEERIKNK